MYFTMYFAKPSFLQIFCGSIVRLQSIANLNASTFYSLRISYFKISSKLRNSVWVFHINWNSQGYLLFLYALWYDRFELLIRQKCILEYTSHIFYSHVSMCICNFRLVTHNFLIKIIRHDMLWFSRFLCVPAMFW